MTLVTIRRPGSDPMMIEVPERQLPELTRVLQLAGINVLRDDGG